VVAVVVTYNRREMLVQCLEALARQTRPVDGVVLVDNASSDGTLEYVTASRVGARVPLWYVRLRRNGGGAEGFHYGVREALAHDCEWLWLMDDDCEPAGDALERLLGSPRAPDAALLAPVVRDGPGRVLPINRGHARPRWLFAPLVAASAAEYASPDDVPIGFCSFVGPLVRASAARRAGLPLREAFIRFEDVEYVQRMPGPKWMVTGAEIVHHDPQPVAGSDARAMWSDFSQPIPFAQQWKRLYGVRNLIVCGRRGGYMRLGHVAAYLLVQAVRTLLFHERRLLTLRLLWLYGRDGWRERFRNVAPARWAGLAAARRPEAFVAREALSYDAEVAEPARRVA
jgi:GT2 family glycosyltransferase